MDRSGLFQIAGEPFAGSGQAALDPLQPVNRRTGPTESGQHGPVGGQPPLLVGLIEQGKRPPLHP